MRANWRLELPQLAVLAAMFVAAGALWSTAPERMPIHWNIQGQVDGWGGKFGGLLLMPLIAAATYVLLLVLPRIDPRRAAYTQFSGAYAAVRLGTVVVLAAIYAITLLAGFGQPVDVGLLVSLLVGALLILVGLVLPRVQPNWFVGIRTPWTLSSHLSWERTHAVGGPVFIAMGLATALTGLPRSQWAMTAMLAIIFGGTIGLAVYSYIVWRSDPNKTRPNGG